MHAAAERGYVDHAPGLAPEHPVDRRIPRDRAARQVPIERAHVPRIEGETHALLAAAQVRAAALALERERDLVANGLDESDFGLFKALARACREGKRADQLAARDQRMTNISGDTEPPKKIGRRIAAALHIFQDRGTAPRGHHTAHGRAEIHIAQRFRGFLRYTAVRDQLGALVVAES